MKPNVALLRLFGSFVLGLLFLVPHGITSEPKSEYVRQFEIYTFMHRGSSYLANDMYDEAIAEVTKALEIDPKLAEAYAVRGQCLFKKEWYDEAISDFTKALELDLKNVQLSAVTYTLRGMSFTERGLYDQAISDYMRALKVDSRFAPAYMGRGIAYFKQGLYRASILDFDRALEVDPRFAEVYFLKAALCEKVGRIDEAVDAYRNYLKCAPPNDSKRIERARKKIRELEGK
jgi:tetratricopeptide (TPR) repeat protein